MIRRPSGRLDATTRATTVAWIVGISALGLALLLGSTVLVLRGVEREDVRSSLDQEAREIALIAESEKDPETGRSFTSAEAFITHYVDRQQPEAAELIVGSVDGSTAIAQAGGERTPRVDELSAPTREALIGAHGRGTLSDPLHGTISHAAVEVTTSTGPGRIVVARFHDAAEQRLVRITLLLAGLALLALTATGAAAWVLSSRILRHTSEFHDGVAHALQGRELRPLPEDGSVEYRRLARRANEIVRRARRLQVRERRFNDDVAYALRTPLALIAAGLRHPGDDGAERRATLAHVRAEADRVTGLVDSLVAVSRLQQGDVVLEPVPVDLAVLAATAAESWRERLPEPENALRVEVTGETDGLPSVTDPARVTQALEELLDNARHAVLHPEGSRTPLDPASLPARGRTLTVDLRREERDGRAWAVVEVLDRGRGVPEDERDDVFSRLATASNDPDPGNGLGLALVRLLAESLGGDVRLTDGPDGVGTAVALAVPAGGTDEDD